MFSAKEVPSGRFNAGEKVWFWGGLVLLGIVMSVTGLILDFPNWNQARESMQLANVIHDDRRGPLHVRGAGPHLPGHDRHGRAPTSAMRDGYVDETWAKEHHVLWYEEVKAGKRPEKIVAGRRATGAGRRLMIKRMRTRGPVAALVLGCAAAWAKIPPPPPLSDKAKAAAEEKKAEGRRREKAKAVLAAAEEKAVKNYQANMKKAGKPIPKPVPIAAAPAAPKAGGAKAEAKKK